MVDYLELANDIIPKSTEPLKGRLGYTINGGYTVVDKNEPGKFYVRFDDGTFCRAQHRNKVPPQPDLPVILHEEADSNSSKYVIDGPDWVEVEAYGSTYAGNLGIGPHTHELGSMMEFPIDHRLLMNCPARPSTGLNVKIDKGFYWNAGELQYFTSKFVNISSLVPGSGEKRYVIVGIDPSTSTAVALAGSAVSSTSDLSPTYISAAVASFIDNGYIPSAAVHLENGQTSLLEFDFYDLRWPVGMWVIKLADLLDVHDSAYPHSGYMLSGDGYYWHSVPFTLPSLNLDPPILIDGDSDSVQLTVQGHSSQTNPIFVIEDSSGNHQFTISNDGAVVINEEGNDSDFRVESDGDANIFFSDGGTNRIGIGTNAPGAKLDVRGSVIINEDSADVDVRIETNNDANAVFVDGGNDNVGFGTGTPNASAKVDIVSTTKGVLLPRMQTTEKNAISTPAESLLLYDTDLDLLQSYIDSAWRDLPYTREVDITSTGTVTGLGVGNATITVVRLDNASDLTIQGITNGYRGRILVLESVGAGNVFLAHENGSATAANRLNHTGFVTSASLPLAAGRGRAIYVYDDTTDRWRLISHVQGNYISYTSTWTASGGGNSIGNGTITSSYLVEGVRVNISLTFSFGSTTNPGSGVWTFSVPIATVTLVSTIFGTTFDSSSGTLYLTFAPISSGALAIMSHNTGLYSATVPITWATGDNFVVNGWYRGA